MLLLLREREVEIPRLAATIFALGIHEDTGSLTYPRTTIRDAEMLAAAMRLGASQALIERYLHSALTEEQREVLMRWSMSCGCERVRGLDVHTVALDVPTYVDGLSVIAHKLMELINAEVLLQAVGMEDRVFVTARSRAGSVDVGALLAIVDGGGHAQAASAVVREQDSRRGASTRCSSTWRRATWALPTAGEIMSRPVRFIDADTPVTDALVTAQRYGHSGICVREDGRVVGIVARRDLDKAMRHGLGHAPVKGVMTRNIAFARASTTVDELRRLMVEGNVGRVPVVTDEAYEAAVRGAVRPGGRRGRHRHPHRRSGRLPGSLGAGAERGGRAPGLHHAGAGRASRSSGGCSGPARRCPRTSPASTWWAASSATCCSTSPTPTSTSPWRATASSSPPAWPPQLGGRVRAHRKFKTAVVLLPPGDPGGGPGLAALRPASPSTSTWPPRAPSSTTIRPRCPGWSTPPSARTCSGATSPSTPWPSRCAGADFGTVIDFFGGLRDLRDGRHPGAAQPELHRGSHPHLPGRALREPLRLPHGRADQELRQELRGHAPGGRPLQRPAARRADRAAQRGRRASGRSAGSSSWAWPARCTPSWPPGAKTVALVQRLDCAGGGDGPAATKW